MITASKAQLRDFYINYHGFDEFFDADGATAVDRIFERLRSIQFDPLNVCGRNAELVLFSRNRNVTKTDLFDALYKRRALADAWDKMMCIIPSAELASFAYVRERMAEDYRLTINRRAQNDCYDCMDEVYSFIEKNGPVLITDIPSRKTNDGRWGSTKIANVCCDYMWYCGRVAVAYKKGVVKAFDTAERVYGAAACENAFADIAEFMRWYVKRRVAAVGALWNKNGGGWLGPYLEKTDGRTPVIAELVERGELVQVAVEGEKAPFYICAGAEKYFEPNAARERAIFVAPLDNLIWDRKLVKSVFGFDYTWEVYVPAEKRRFGYYVLPIIIGNKFIGRLGPRQYRAGEPFDIKNVWYEPNYAPTADDIDLICAEFNRLAAFSGAELDKNVKEKLRMKNY